MSLNSYEFERNLRFQGQQLQTNSVQSKHARRLELPVQLILFLERVRFFPSHLRPFPVVIMRLDLGIEVVLVLKTTGQTAV
jgi:hypothetical protein